MAMDGPIFVLDIGTRSVVGIAGHPEGGRFVVDGWAMELHPRRAMIDGQIEDIPQVAEVARTVKQRLESTLGTTFTRVSVAAAGRALKTSRATCKQSFHGAVITAQMAFGLENAAVNEARLGLDGQTGETPYTCVGHAVVCYTLDGYPFNTVVGHRAQVAEVEIIATFLPTEVVESLHQCMALLDLEIDVMTLEPIAAMRAVIPQDLRLLNLALVDIGAGTSDIAISNNSTVAGYSMATVAGDEITESLVRQYLIDFNTAERLKLATAEDGEQEFTDILGFTHTASSGELYDTIRPTVEMVADVVAGKIIECNGGAVPAAVFLVGGGSKTPGLREAVADGLPLLHNKVALAGTNFSGRILNEDSGLDSPEFATPVGIALIAMDSAGTSSAAVTIGGRRVRLFLAEATTVMDALLLGGYRYSDVMGRNGRSLTFSLNGERTVVRGGPYTTATISLNGKPASLSAPVKDGDAIEIEPAQNGEDATATVASYLQAPSISVTLNGEALKAGPVAHINGAAVEAHAPIHEQDTVEVFALDTVGALCAACGVPTAHATVAVNQKTADIEYLLQEGDEVTITLPDGLQPLVSPQTVIEPVTEAPVYDQPPPAAPPSPVQSPAPEVEPPSVGQEEPPKIQSALAAEENAPPPPPSSAPNADTAPATAQSLRVTLNGKTIVLPPKAGEEGYFLLDMFTLVDIDPANPKGEIQILLNGRDAAYLDPLSTGDVIEIGWEEF